MASWAKPGVKCVCVNLDGINLFGDAPCPSIGEIYTISRTDVAHGFFDVELVELPPPDEAGNWYHVGHFRPLVTKTQEEDVAMFKRIADDVPTLEPIT